MKHVAFLSKVAAIAVISVASCKKDSEVVPNLSGVEDQFKQYVLRFAAEAKARNVSVDLSKLTIKAVSQRIVVGSGSYCGYTFSTLPADVSIQIADIKGCWSDQTDLNKEILIFHELGHGILRRSHLDTRLPNGLWTSMMQSSNEFDMYNEFTLGLRTYYLDELFNPATSSASVVKSHANTKIIMQDSIAVASDWTFVNGSATSHVGSVTSAEFTSPGHSLSIASSVADGANQFSYFRRTISVAGVSATSDVLVNFNIKLKTVTQGASVAVNVFSQGKFSAFYTTQGDINFTGTQDFKRYSLRVPYFPEKADSMIIYLILFGETTGTVIFDDIEVVNNY